MKNSEIQEIEDLYETIVDLFDRRCHICGMSYDKKNKKGKRKAFVLHHREYPKGWKKWSDFKMKNKKGKLVHDKLNYLRYLIPMIAKLPKAKANKIFRLIHHSHHWAAENFARHKQPALGRMIELVLEINEAKYPSNHSL